MQKKLTITVDEEVYEGLHRNIGRRKISKFIEGLVKPYVIREDLEAAYEAMANDYERESGALGWGEATIGDALDEEG